MLTTEKSCWMKILCLHPGTSDVSHGGAASSDYKEFPKCSFLESLQLYMLHNVSELHESFMLVRPHIYSLSLNLPFFFFVFFFLKK